MKRGLKSIISGTFMTCLVFTASFCVNTASADTAAEKNDIAAPVVEKREPAKDWKMEVSSGAVFSNVFTDTAKAGGYTLVPVQLSGILAVDSVSNDKFLNGILRGYTDFIFRGNYYNVLHGVENHMFGISVGPRYNFVQPGWKLVPYVEGTVGVLFADSQPNVFQTGANSFEQHGLGQDFNFTFGIAAGARYEFTEDWYGALSVHYMHVSNAGMSEPEFKNKAIDALGPQVSVGHTF